MAGHTVRTGRTAVAILLGGVSLLVVACTGPAPRQTALGEDIEVGPCAFRVLRARNAPNPPPPLNTFRDLPGRSDIVVFVYWRTLDGDLDALGRLEFIHNFLEEQFVIADSDGRRTKVSGAMQTGLMSMEEPGLNWRDWVVVFNVPDTSRGLTLLVENPEPRQGQARLTAVPLGM